MSEHGAALQTYNQELVKCLEDLKQRRQETLQMINSEEEEARTLEANIKELQEKLSGVNASLTQHKLMRDGYERTITDAEAAFKKLLEGSQALLSLVQSEVNKLNGNGKLNASC